MDKCTHLGVWYDRSVLPPLFLLNMISDLRRLVPL